jgi:2-phospho-L-lactate guanylyltransferase
VSEAADIWAVVPVKEMTGAKQRLAGVLSEGQRRALASVMLEDVLEAMVAVSELAGIGIVTVDPEATRLARRIGARVFVDGARDGHTGAVTAAARMLAGEGRGGMITVPGDIPRLTPAEFSKVLAAHRPAPSFTTRRSCDVRANGAGGADADAGVSGRVPGVGPAMTLDRDGFPPARE